MGCRIGHIFLLDAFSNASVHAPHHTLCVLRPLRKACWIWLSKRVARKSSLASHTLRRERKGLVTLQPSSCPHDQSDPHSSLIASVVMHLFYLSAVWWNCFLRRQLGSCRPSLCEGGSARLQEDCGSKIYSSDFKQWMWTRLESIWILKIIC